MVKHALAASFGGNSVGPLAAFGEPLPNVTDFVGASVKIAQRDSRVVEMYAFVAVVYFALCLTLSTLVKVLQKRIAIIR